MMDITELYVLQKELDEVVDSKIRSDYNRALMLNDTVYAFHIELGELANEVGWFKYWKNSHEINRWDTLEELSDCIHLLLKIGLLRGYDKTTRVIEHYGFSDASQLRSLFQAARKFDIENERQYQSLFEILLTIGFILGYTDSEILQMYRVKNLKNRERQANDY